MNTTRVLFIALADLRYQLRQRETLLWLLIMPPVFFYFIGTVTGGSARSFSGEQATPLAVVAENPGFLREQVDRRLRDNDFEPHWYDEQEAAAWSGEPPARVLRFAPGMTQQVRDGKQVPVRFTTASSSLGRDFDLIRVQRSLYTALADIVVADARDALPLTPGDLAWLNTLERPWTLTVEPAGQRREIPSGFQQAVPGILVMFTLLILLTSGASLLTIERRQGLLRRLAYAPLTRTEIVSGKWLARMGLAIVQVGFALIVGTVVFGMDWGPDFATVLLVLFAWAAFCASAGLWLGCVAATEGQAAGLGVLAANALAALGGCWWPIEITPSWMQALQKLLPTGWTMDALHKLVSFGAGAQAALPNVIVLAVASVLVLWLAVRQFRYQ